MKTLLLALAIAASLTASAQCQTPLVGSAHITFPSFVTLLNNGRCASGLIQDTTICTRIARRVLYQRAAFSFSSPIGEPVFLTGITQYDRFCNVVAFGNIIAPGTDTVTVCYSIQTELIDNFCPYALILIPLAVEWCGVSCHAEAGVLTVNFSTCSNINTDRFEILLSSDGQVWNEITRLPPYFTNNSNRSDYTITTGLIKAGIQYVRIREVDLNGNISLSEVCYFANTYGFEGKSGYIYDLAGRLISK